MYDRTRCRRTSPGIIQYSGSRKTKTGKSFFHILLVQELAAIQRAPRPAKKAAKPKASSNGGSGRENGTVKWFNTSKGFGFITRDDGGDVFVHFRSIQGEGHRALQEGQRVSYVVANRDKGLQAEDVTILNERKR